MKWILNSESKKIKNIEQKKNKNQKKKRKKTDKDNKKNKIQKPKKIEKQTKFSFNIIFNLFNNNSIISTSRNLYPLKQIHTTKLIKLILKKQHGINNSMDITTLSIIIYTIFENNKKSKPTKNEW